MNTRHAKPARAQGGAGTGAVVLLSAIALAMWWSHATGHNASLFVPPSGGDVAINAAIKKCAEKGGEVQLGPGIYTCRKPIVIDASRVSLRGAGPSTILRLDDMANCPVIVVGEPSGDPKWEVSNVRVSNLAIDGNREKQDEECWSGMCDTGGSTAVRLCGIVVRRATDVLVENVSITRCRSGGLVSEKGCRRLTVRQLESSDHEFDALACYETTNSLFTQLHLHGNKAAGISTDGGFHDNLVTHAIITDNGTHGIYMRNSNENLFQGIMIRNSGSDGIFVDQVDQTEGTAACGNSFIGLHVTGSAKHAIRLNHPNCRHNLIDGSQFTDNQGDIYEATPGLAKFEAAYGR